MPAPDWDALNRSIIGGFAEPELFQYRPHHSQPPFDAQGIFDSYQVDVPDPEGGPPTSARRTSLGVQQSAFPPDFQHTPRDRVHVRGVTYDVTDALPDGLGWVYLTLGRIGS
jgi:hypothetical protein